MRATDDRSIQFTAALLLAITLCTRAAPAADDKGGGMNQLTPQEKADGWVLLFDGKSPGGWTTGDKPLPAKNIRDGAINPHGAGEYVSYFNQPFGDFVLSCEFKTTKGANSGIFFRVGDKKDPVQTGIEFQVHDDPPGRAPNRNGGGAIYDLQAPSANAMKPAGEWNHVQITADKNIIRVVLNGRQVIDMDIDRWTTPRKNPDGSENKFAKALKDFPRTGYIGLQDHGQDVWFRNIKVKRLDRKAR